MHARRQGAAQFLEQPAALVGRFADGVHGTPQRHADDFGAHRVAIGRRCSAVQQRRHVAVELAQFPLAGVGDLHAQAVGGDALVDFVIADQAQRLPRRGVGCAARGGARRDVTEHLLPQQAREHAFELGEISLQVGLRSGIAKLARAGLREGPGN